MTGSPVSFRFAGSERARLNVWGECAGWPARFAGSERRPACLGARVARFAGFVQVRRFGRGAFERLGRMCGVGG